MLTTLLATIAVGLPQIPSEALDVWAQPAGLRVLRCRLDEGDIVVYMPARIGAGEAVSGMIVVEPRGDSTAARSRNLDRLSSYKLESMGKSLQAREPAFTIETPEDGSSVEMVVRSESGNISATMTTEINNGHATDEPAACPVVEAGTAIRVVGQFDGRRDSTFAYIDGVPAGVIAEGTADCIVSTMNASLGQHKLRIRDKGVESEHLINIVRVSVKLPQDAKVGKRNSVLVTVDGLEGVDSSSFPMSVILSSSASDQLDSGLESEALVNPEAVDDGKWTGAIEFKPKKKGSFSVFARLVCDSFLRRIGVSR